MTKVFISYAHASTEHRAAVRDLWGLLRSSGIDVVFDWWGPEPTRRDWSTWVAQQITDADLVLVVASPEYKQLTRQPSKSLAVAEAQLIRGVLATSGGASADLASVVLPGHSADEVPDFLTASGSPVQVLEDFTPRGARRLLQWIVARTHGQRGETEPRTFEALDPEPTEIQREPTMLVLATEWSSARGGLSTLNRQLCCALAARRKAKVVCLVLAADETDHRDAAANGVVLLVAERPPGGSDDTALSNPAALPAEFRPDYIIGHSRVTGPAAFQIAAHFPDAKRLHFIHMAPDEIEWYKPGREDDAGQRSEERHELELELARSAHATVAVGLRLYNRYLRDLSPNEDVLVHNLVPGFDVAEHTCATPPGAPWKILIAGRLDDAELKGLDIAARAVGRIARNRPPTVPRVELVVRGAPPGEAEQLRKQVLEWADLPALDVVVRPYSTNRDTMTADLTTSTLVLMPSRREGFGLIGLEAAAAGVPVLVSGSSGLGEQLLAVLDPVDCARVVIPVTGDAEADADHWQLQIHAVLYDREAAFGRAARVREQLIASYTWTKAVTDLFASLSRARTR